MSGGFPRAQYQREEQQLGSSWARMYLRSTWIATEVRLMEEGKRKYRQAQHQLLQAVRKQGQLKHRQALQQQRYSMWTLNLAP